MLKQLPVFTVHGQNWLAHVPIDEFNSQFDIDAQMREACSRAIDVVHKVMVKDQVHNPHKIEIELDENEKSPVLGPMMLVYLKDGDPNKGELYPTHIVLADCGFYRKSLIMKELYDQQMAKIKEDQEAEDARAAHQSSILDNEIKNFEQLAEDVKKLKNTKKPNKPKKAPKKRKGDSGVDK